MDDVKAKYIWVTYPGKVVSATPPGREWVPVKTVRKGVTVAVLCVYRGRS